MKRILLVTAMLLGLAGLTNAQIIKTKVKVDSKPATLKIESKGDIRANKGSNKLVKKQLITSRVKVIRVKRKK